MRYLPLAAVFLAAPAFAQPAQQPSPETRALDSMIQACNGREFLATRAVVAGQDQITALQKQIADMTKQLTDAKATLKDAAAADHQ